MLDLKEKVNPLQKIADYFQRLKTPEQKALVASCEKVIAARNDRNSLLLDYLFKSNIEKFYEIPQGKIVVDAETDAVCEAVIKLEEEAMNLVETNTAQAERIKQLEEELEKERNKNANNT